jgi:hypothetical protein
MELGKLQYPTAFGSMSIPTGIETSGPNMEDTVTLTACFLHQHRGRPNPVG